MSNPLDSHWTTIKRILRYLQRSLSHGLRLKPAISSQPLPLRGDVDGHLKWMIGAAVYLGVNLISLWSRKQQMVARSSNEAEYRSLAQVTT